ncbi:MAG: hypothetical protein R3192_03275 [Woeseiaceae bacterium]|nr:hypothetical protein [Woeseiaceae bacterium]
MTFNGPASVDYQNVFALNHDYLSLLRSTRVARQGIDELSPGLRSRITSLSAGEAKRLATAPFMLVSLRERDDRLWEQIFSGRHELSIEPPAEDLLRLASATLGFVWQLARQNPYTLRLICGASLHWCECIAERTLVELLAAVSAYPNLLTLQRGDDHDLWRKLLSDGVNRNPRVCRAAQMCALQTVLTQRTADANKRWAVAACNTVPESLQVADKDA